MSKRRRILASVSGVAIAVAVVVGCSETVTGTPQADPAQTGGFSSPEPSTRITSPSPATSSTATSSTSSSSTAPTRTSGAAPADAGTTCAEYSKMDDEDKRAVIAEIGGDNDVVALNPELWISVVGALCTFAEPSTRVEDVLSGQGIG